MRTGGAGLDLLLLSVGLLALPFRKPRDADLALRKSASSGGVSREVTRDESTSTASESIASWRLLKTDPVVPVGAQTHQELQRGQPGLGAPGICQDGQEDSEQLH